VKASLRLATSRNEPCTQLEPRAGFLSPLSLPAQRKGQFLTLKNGLKTEILFDTMQETSSTTEENELLPKTYD
jgi:hypothetical protein